MYVGFGEAEGRAMCVLGCFGQGPLNHQGRWGERQRQHSANVNVQVYIAGHSEATDRSGASMLAGSSISDLLFSVTFFADLTLYFIYHDQWLRMPHRKKKSGL